MDISSPQARPIRALPTTPVHVAPATPRFISEDFDAMMPEPQEQQLPALRRRLSDWTLGEWYEGVWPEDPAGALTERFGLRTSQSETTHSWMAQRSESAKRAPAGSANDSDIIQRPQLPRQKDQLIFPNVLPTYAA